MSKEMTLQRLGNYRNLILEIDHIAKEAQRLQQDMIYSAVLASDHESPYTKREIIIKALPKNNWKLMRRLRAKERELLNERECIEAFLDGIDDGEIRTIIRSRYITGKHQTSWQSVAMKMGYASEHTPRRKLVEFFKDGGNGGNSNLQ